MLKISIFHAPLSPVISVIPADTLDRHSIRTQNYKKVSTWTSYYGKISVIILTLFFMVGFCGVDFFAYFCMSVCKTPFPDRHE